MKLTPEEKKQQEYYRDARITGEYEKIWKSVGECVFCNLKEQYIVFEENGMVLIPPLFAYIDGHLLIIPKRHIESAKELTPAEWETVRKMMYIAKKMIREVHGIKGMQFIQKDGRQAQSTVGHLHFHCIPFDGPDLSTWHYRKLAYTPIENVALYKRKNKDIKKYAKKFDDKYKDGT